MINHKIFLTLICIIYTLLTFNSFGQFTQGDVYYGFKLLKKEFVKEVNAECYYFVHVKSGARLLKIAADDPNKTFSIAFKTVPQSDGGTPHIIEHSVLNGSKNFPVKSPFDVLAKGSLNTFLNAMTGSDITIYPVASMNDKDYFNLMHVYLDAVFNPLVLHDKRIFEQEGWHYEDDSVNSPIKYNGVVYNEMKGAFSSPTRELYYNMYKNLFPDNCYGYSSGGYPMAIPHLTYENFIKFYKRFYHPSNSYIYLYGNADLDKELKFIDSDYLSDYNKIDVNSDIPLQKPFKAMKEVTDYYSVTEDSDVKDQTYLSLSFVIGLNTDRALVMSLNMLSDLLVNQESAPIRIALQKAGIGKEVSAGVDDIEQNVFEIKVQNANPADKDKFKEIVFNTLKDVAKNGLDSLAVQGSLNRTEFGLREGNDAQKGLSYNFNALSSWFFANDPFPGLEYEKSLAKLKSDIYKNSLEDIIKTDMVDNPHSLLLTLVPKPGLEKINNDKIEKELSDYKASLSEQQIKDLIKNTIELKDYQKKEDTPEALATIPLLSLKDINPEAEWYTLDKQTINNIPVLAHNEFTNGVVYAKLNFDMRVLPEKMIPYAALLSEVMVSMNTENYSYSDLEKQLNINTGGFNTYLTSYVKDMDDANLIPKFVVSSKAMNDKVGKMFDLMSEIVNKTRYADKDRLKEVLSRDQSRIEASVKSNGYQYAQTRLTSYFSNQGMFNELTDGIAYYRFISGLAKNFDTKSDEIIANLVQTAKLLFTKDNCVASVTCANDDMPNYLKGFNEYADKMAEGKPVYNKWKFDLEKKNEGFITASKVQYVVEGYDYKKLGLKWSGKYYVLNQVLSTDYLQNHVRVLGGAYGGWARFSPTGLAYFASYRDPHLKQTLANYDSTVNYLNNFDANDNEMTRYIIGTVSGLDRPLTPSSKGDLAFRRYLQNETKQYVQNIRDEVLATSAEDIKSMSKLVGAVIAEKAYCVYGNEDKIKSEKDLFKEVVPLNPETAELKKRVD
jgi:Zn-dependent M16 (insulinase) family peptidase